MVTTAGSNVIIVVWAVTPYIFVDRDHRFGRACRLRLQNRHALFSICDNGVRLIGTETFGIVTHTDLYIPGYNAV
jgi:hypothetical protein